MSINQISFTGNGLNIMIIADYNFHNEWMAFSSWYTIHKVLPEADVCVAIPKQTNSIKNYYFRWTTKAGVKQYRLPNIECPAASSLLIACAVLDSGCQQPFIMIDSGIVAARELIPEKLNARVGISQSVWLINGINKKELVDASNHFFNIYEKNKNALLVDSLKIIKGYEEINGLCSDCTSKDASTFISINETCGLYNKKTWLEKAKSPPFTHVRKLKTPNTSVNERIVLNFWEQMQHSYSLMV